MTEPGKAKPSMRPLENLKVVARLHRIDAATLRERAMMRRQIKVLTAEGRLSAWVLAVLPFAIGLYMFAVNPEYISLLVTTQVGLIMLGTGGVLMVLGILWMRKIVDIDV